MADIDSVSAAALECWDRVSRQDAPWLPEPALDWLIDQTGWDLRRAVREVAEVAEAIFRMRTFNSRNASRWLWGAQALLEQAATYLPRWTNRARQVAREGRFAAETARPDPAGRGSRIGEILDRDALTRLADDITAAADLLDRLRTAAA